MTSYLSLKPAPPAFSTADIIHGPEMNIGTWPLTKSGSVVGVAGAALSEMPSVKYDWILRGLEHLGLSKLSTCRRP